VDASQLALVRGVADTRTVLARWNDSPWPVMRAWLAMAGVIAVGLLLAVWVLARTSTPDPTPLVLPGLQKAGTWGDVAHVLLRNSLVLALHAFACVAGFIAGSSLPVVAQGHRGTMRWIHEKAGPLAIAFVVAATTFSLATQAYALGGAASTLSAQLGMSPGMLLLGLLPHAIPELFALFLPLAAWMLASRRGDWHELFAATVVTVAVAVPMLVAAATIEVFVSPGLIRALGGMTTPLHFV
jgi:Stage II sporulation protein M